MWMDPDGYPLDINPALSGGTAAVRLELDFHPDFFYSVGQYVGVLLLLTKCAIINIIAVELPWLVRLWHLIISIMATKLVSQE